MSRKKAVKAMQPPRRESPPTPPSDVARKTCKRKKNMVHKTDAEAKENNEQDSCPQRAVSGPTKDNSPPSR